jgi:uncharacterized protein YcfJ
MNNTIRKFALALTALAAVTQASAQVIFFENDGFQGRSFTAQEQVADFAQFGFNDRASSVVVHSSRWEVCENAGFGGRCVVLQQGRYDSLTAMGLNDRVSSVRPVANNARSGDDRYAHGGDDRYGRSGDDRYAAAAAPTNDWHRRKNERLYQANVTSARAVVGPPEQRCWVEREQIVQEQRGNANVPGGIVGAVVGGILGHQVGGGSGRDLATIGGVVAGAAIGANVGRGSTQQVTTQDVQRCASAPSQRRPDFWDVTYNFRGQEHHVQLTALPGPTVTVNRAGEPRG